MINVAVPGYSLCLTVTEAAIILVRYASLKCVDGIPHDRGPCTAVLGHLHADHWPLQVPSLLAIDPRSIKKREVLLDGPRPGLQFLAGRMFVRTNQRLVWVA